METIKIIGLIIILLLTIYSIILIIMIIKIKIIISYIQESSEEEYFIIQIENEVRKINTEVYKNIVYNDYSIINKDFLNEHDNKVKLLCQNSIPYKENKQPIICYYYSSIVK